MHYAVIQQFAGHTLLSIILSKQRQFGAGKGRNRFFFYELIAVKFELVHLHFERRAASVLS